MGLPYFFLSLLILLLVALLIIRLWLKQLEDKTKTSADIIAWLKDIGQRLENSTAIVDAKLTKNMDMFNTRLDNAAQVIAKVQKNIGEFSEIGRSMRELQEFLRSPKLRGNIGEQVLRDLLMQYFPPSSYLLQYSFKNGEKVDAVIKTSQGLIPIDSKFPLDNFRKFIQAADEINKTKLKKEFLVDVKKHIVDIHRKYILVSEGTVDYALMYIPSESVYYEIINDATLYDFAGEKQVLPVSPLSFYAYMKAVLMSFEGQKIETKAKEILELLQSMKKDYEKTQESLSVLTKHVVNAYNQTAQVDKNLGLIGQKLSSTRLLSHVDDSKKNATIMG